MICTLTVSTLYYNLFILILYLNLFFNRIFMQIKLSWLVIHQSRICWKKCQHIFRIGCNIQPISFFLPNHLNLKIIILDRIIICNTRIIFSCRSSFFLYIIFMLFLKINFIESIDISNCIRQLFLFILFYWLIKN